MNHRLDACVDFARDLYDKAAKEFEEENDTVYKLQLNKAEKIFEYQQSSIYEAIESLNNRNEGVTKLAYLITINKKLLQDSFLFFVSQCKELEYEGKTIESKLLLFGGGSLDEDVQSVFSSRKMFETAQNKYKFKISPDETPFPRNYFINEIALSDEEKKRLVISSQLANPKPPELSTPPVMVINGTSVTDDFIGNVVVHTNTPTGGYIVNKDGTVEFF